MKDQSNIDEIFKEAFDQFEVDPGSNVWTTIQAGISSSAAAASSASSASASATTASASWITTAIVGLAISAAAVGGYYLFNQHGEAKVNEAISQKNAQDAENKIEKKTNNTKSESTDVVATKRKELGKSKEKVALEKNETIQASRSNEKQEGENNSTANKNQSEEKTALLDTISNSSHNSNNALKSTSEESNNSVDAVNSEESSSQLNAEGKTPKESTQNDELSIKDKTNSSEENEFIDPLDNKNDKVDVVDVKFPNAFSPNQDGTNDIFEIRHDQSSGLNQIQEARMIIKDNTGKTVAIWNGVNEGWDGSISDGSNAPSGIYVYQFSYSVNGIPIDPATGLITLSR